MIPAGSPEKNSYATTRKVKMYLMTSTLIKKKMTFIGLIVVGYWGQVFTPIFMKVAPNITRSPISTPSELQDILGAAVKWLIT